MIDTTPVKEIQPTRPAPTGAGCQPRSATSRLFKRHVALPAEHGAWVFLFSPLLAGLVLGGRFTLASLLLVIASLAAFLVRQPVIIAVKAYSGRRPRAELPAARFWMVIYGLAALGAVSGLAALGYAPILVLAAPAVPVLAWHLWLVSRRAERRQALLEIIGSGALALAAPAAYWIGRGGYDPAGWLLAGLLWLQSAGSIVYAFLRLDQRQLQEAPPIPSRLQMARPALLFTSANFLLSVILAAAALISAWLPLAFAVQLAESLWGAFKPAVKVKPVRIGVRQLIVSTVFTVLFILFW